MSQIQTKFIANNAITNAKLAQMPTVTIKGNSTGGTANATDLTGAQVNTILPTFTSTLNGLAPSSGGGTTNFLRADGTWNAPSAGASAYNITNQSAAYNASANDYVICSGASFAVTLPTAVGSSGKAIVIEHNGTSLTDVYTLNTTSSQTIGGVAGGSYALYTAGETITLVSDNANWQIQDHKTETTWTNSGATYITATSAYTFTIPSSSITAGTVYTNNGFTYTVSTTTASSTTLTCSGTGTPQTSGTLTFVSGSPSGNLAFSARTITGAPVKGTVVNDNLWWKRSGNTASFRIEFNQTVSGTAGSGDYLFFLPTNISFNTSLMTLFTTLSVGSGVYPFSSLGTGLQTSTSGPTAQIVQIVPFNSNSFRVWNSANGVMLESGSGGVSLGTPVNYAFTFSTPIANWQP
jgi:hypothetical protein